MSHAAETKNWTKDINEDISQTNSRKRKMKGKFRRRQSKRLTLGRRYTRSVFKREQRATEDSSPVSDSADSDNEDQSNVSTKSLPLTKKAQLEVPLASKKDINGSSSKVNGSKINGNRTPRPPLQKISNNSSSSEVTSESESESIPDEANNNKVIPLVPLKNDGNEKESSETSLVSNLEDKVMDDSPDQHLQADRISKDIAATVSGTSPEKDTVSLTGVSLSAISQGSKILDNTPTHATNLQNSPTIGNSSSKVPSNGQSSTPSDDKKTDQDGSIGQSKSTLNADASSPIESSNSTATTRDAQTELSTGLEVPSKDNQQPPTSNQGLNPGEVENSDKSSVLSNSSRINCFAEREQGGESQAEQSDPDASNKHSGLTEGVKPDIVTNLGVVDDMPSGESQTCLGGSSSISQQQFTPGFLPQHDNEIITKNSLSIRHQDSNTNCGANSAPGINEVNSPTRSTVSPTAYNVGSTNGIEPSESCHTQQENVSLRQIRSGSIGSSTFSVGENMWDRNATQYQHTIRWPSKIAQELPPSSGQMDNTGSTVLNSTTALPQNPNYSANLNSSFQGDPMAPHHSLNTDGKEHQKPMDDPSKQHLNESFSHSSTNHDIDYSTVKTPDLPESVITEETAGEKLASLNVTEDITVRNGSLNGVAGNEKPEIPRTMSNISSFTGTGSENLPMTLLSTRRDYNNGSLPQFPLNTGNNSVNFVPVPTLGDNSVPGLNGYFLNPSGMNLTFYPTYGYYNQYGGYINNSEVPNRLEASSGQSVINGNGGIWNNLQPNPSPSSMVNIPQSSSNTQLGATSAVPIYQTQREPSRFRSRNDLVNLISQGILNHDPICSSPTVSVTNNICTTTNYEMMGLFHQQLILQMEDLDYVAINGPFSVRYEKYGHALIPKQLSVSIQPRRSTDDLTSISGTGTGLYDIKGSESRGGKSNSEVLLSQKQKSTVLLDAEKDDSSVQKYYSVTSKDKVHSPSRLKWKQEWERKLRRSRIYMPGVPPSSCVTGDQTGINQRYNLIRDILRSHFRAQIVDRFDESVDIVILKGKVGECKGCDSLEHIINTSIKSHSGKRRRVWSVEKLSQFITNMGINLDAWRGESSLKQNHLSSETPELPQVMPYNDVTGNVPAVANKVRTLANTVHTSEKWDSRLPNYLTDTHNIKRSETYTPSIRDSEGLLRNVEELLDQAITSLQNKENELMHARGIIQMLVNEAMNDQLTVSSLYGSLYSVNEEKRATNLKLIQLKEEHLLDTTSRRKPRKL